MTRLARLLLAAVALTAATPPRDPPRDAPGADLDLAAHCAAVLGVAAGRQAAGAPEARSWPPLAVRGREFFVQVGARLIDERHLSREAVAALLRSEAARVEAEANAAADPAAAYSRQLEPCLQLLEATVPSAGLLPPSR